MIEVHPEAVKEVDNKGWLPLNHYCRGLGGEYDDCGDDVERHLGTLEERRAAPYVFGDGDKGADRPGDPKFFAKCECLADVRKEYKLMLLKYHPDKNIGKEEEATRQMQRLMDAYAEAIKKYHEKRPLEEAVSSGDVGQVLASLETMSGEDVRDFVDAEGNTLLHLVCSKCARNVAADQLAAVVRANPEALNEQNSEGDTPLHCLCASHRSPAEFESLVAVLLGDYALEEEDEEEGGEAAGGGEDAAAPASPAKSAGSAAPGSPSKATQEEECLDAAARPNADGRLPAHLLCRCQRFAGKKSVGALRRLIEAFPAGAAHADAFDWTPLHLFAQFQIDPSLEGLLLVLGACPGAASRTTIVDADTPLHLACYAHRRKISPGAALTLGTMASFAPLAALRACKQGKRPWDHLPRDDPLFPKTCAAILRAVIAGLEEVRLDVEDEVRSRSRLEAGIRSFRDSRGGTLLHVVAGPEGADLTRAEIAVVAAVVEEGAAGEADGDGATPLQDRKSVV